MVKSVARDHAWWRRFILDRVTIGDGCWEWQRGKTTAGYGLFGVGARPSIQYIYAHRKSYEIWIGEIPDGAEVLHRCDNPSCVRPSHLKADSHKANMADMSKKGRACRGEDMWSNKLSESQVWEVYRLGSLGMYHHDIGAKFGVTRSNIGAILKGRSWPHLYAQWQARKRAKAAA